MMPAQSSGARWMGSSAEGSGIDEVGAGEGELGVAAVDGVAGEDGVVAEVFHAVGAEAAGAVGAAHPGDADAGADGEVGGGAVDDFADDLVAGDDGGCERWEIALDDVEVGAADSAGEDAEQDVVGEQGGRGDFFDAEEVAGSGEGGVEDGGLHGVRLTGWWEERQMRITENTERRKEQR